MKWYLLAKLLADNRRKKITDVGATVLSSPTPTFKILLRGENKAGTKQLLLDQIFVLTIFTQNHNYWS